MSQPSANEWGPGEQSNPDGPGADSETGSTSETSQPDSTGETLSGGEAGSRSEVGSEQWEHRDQAQTSTGSASDSSGGRSQYEQYGTAGGGQSQQASADPYGQSSASPYAQGGTQYGQPSAGPQGDWNPSQQGDWSADQYGQGSANQPYGQGSANQYGQPGANPQGGWSAGAPSGQSPQGMPNQGMYAPQGGTPNQGYPPQGGPMMSGAPVPQSDEKLWGMLTHVLMVLTGFLGPLIVYLIYKDRSKWILDNAKESLNFGILTTIVMFVGGILTTVAVGFIVIAVWPILVLIFGILAAVAANKGQFYKYPLNLRLVS